VRPPLYKVAELTITTTPIAYKYSAMLFRRGDVVFLVEPYRLLEYMHRTLGIYRDGDDSYAVVNRNGVEWHSRAEGQVIGIVDIERQPYYEPTISVYLVNGYYYHIVVDRRYGKYIYDVDHYHLLVFSDIGELLGAIRLIPVKPHHDPILNLVHTIVKGRERF